MALDFIPLSQYTDYFHILVLCLIFIAFWQCASGNILKQNVAEFNAGWGFVLAILIIIYMGLRPVSGVFGDTINYANGFERFKGIPMRWVWDGEWLFQNLMHWFARVSGIHLFFLFCSTLYVLPLWIAMHRMFGNYSYVPFLIIICQIFLRM